jgi:hypothetical protein
MRRTLMTVHCLVFTFVISACLPDIAPISIPASPPSTALYIYRFEIPAFVGFSEDLQITKEIPFSYPVNCGLFDTFPAPQGQLLAVELTCPNGQSVLFLDTETGTISLPFSAADSHFLAWQSDGLAAYLKVDSLTVPRIVRAYVGGGQDILAIPEFAYDLAAKPDSRDFTFTLSRGLGYGSELHLARQDGNKTTMLYSDPYNYLSFARFSLYGKQIAFIKIPDTQTPFTVGELWVADADGANARRLADADAGHGYAANWSPDGTRIAYVVRENPDDEAADQSSEALVSNIYLVEVASGAITQLTSFEEGYAETPHWSADGNMLAFNVVIDGRMNVFIADVSAVGVGSSNPLLVEIKPLVTGPACCPAWMRK